MRSARSPRSDACSQPRRHRLPPQPLDRVGGVPAIDIANADLLLTTTKQVRKRLDLSRPVPRELLLECIDIASHAPMGGNQERNRWMIIDDQAIKDEITPLYQSIGRPYLAAGGEDAAGRQARVVESAAFLVEH